ncbi:MAG: TlpA family protein disulfide reductase [Planctomycetota bacterium]|jgi:hypothetical protein
MYPHERSLVTRMKDRPFALLGINSDRDRGKIQQTCKDKNLTWRSFWDESTSGPIATRWNISGWPTVYILDHQGVIRAKSVGFRDFDSLIEKLVEAAEKDTQERQ